MPQNRVLVVDDYADTADSMAALLRQSGCEVETADNGVSALDRAAHFRPELILMDLRMPLLDGVEACRRIRETWWGRNILIAAFTGAGLQPYQADIRQAGFDCFLLKPVPFVAIQKLLDSLRCY